MPEAAKATISAIYVASPEGDTGKSTIALGILHRLAANVARVGVFRPITRDDGEDRDYILEMLLDHTTAGLPYEDCVGVTYQQLHEDFDAALAEIVDRYHRVADQCDAVLVVGSDYTDVAAPSELSVNARIAANLGAPVVLAVKAQGAHPSGSPRSPRSVSPRSPSSTPTPRPWSPTDATRPSWPRCARRCSGSNRAATCYRGLLVAPSVAELRVAVDGTVVQGDKEMLHREVLDVLVAGMTAEHVLERLTEGVAVITPATAPMSCSPFCPPTRPTGSRRCPQ